MLGLRLGIVLLLLSKTVCVHAATSNFESAHIIDSHNQNSIQYRCIESYPNSDMCLKLQFTLIHGNEIHAIGNIIDSSEVQALSEKLTAVQHGYPAAPIWEWNHADDIWGDRDRNFQYAMTLIIVEGIIGTPATLMGVEFTVYDPATTRAEKIQARTEREEVYLPVFLTFGAVALGPHIADICDNSVQYLKYLAGKKRVKRINRRLTKEWAAVWYALTNKDSTSSVFVSDDTFQHLLGLIKQ